MRARILTDLFINQKNLVKKAEALYSALTSNEIEPAAVPVKLTKLKKCLEQILDNDIAVLKRKSVDHIYREHQVLLDLLHKTLTYKQQLSTADIETVMKIDSPAGRHFQLYLQLLSYQHDYCSIVRDYLIQLCDYIEKNKFTFIKIDVDRKGIMFAYEVDTVKELRILLKDIDKNSTDETVLSVFARAIEIINAGSIYVLVNELYSAQRDKIHELNFMRMEDPIVARSVLR